MEEVEEDNFDIDWLNERYPFDAEARNKALELKVKDHFSDKAELTFVDVGSGTGSNCLYFIDHFPQSQKWYLVEQNESFKKATIRRFKDYAAYHKYTFERKKNRLKISSVKKTVVVELINDSLLNLPQLLDLKKVDLVLANAVFDLFTAKQLTAFTELLIEHRLPFYTTLSYETMNFLPEDPFDDVFIDAYNAHMERPQKTGKALGKKAIRFMVDLFEKHKIRIETAPSTWRIESDDIKMHYYLLNFMENALGEMDLDASMMANFGRWTQRKKDLIITRRQRLEIGHLDIFAGGK